MLAAPDTFAAAVTVSGIVMKGMSDISHQTIRILRFACKPTRDIANDALLRPDCLCDSAQTIRRRFSNICLWVFFGSLVNRSVHSSPRNAVLAIEQATGASKKCAATY